MVEKLPHSQNLALIRLIFKKGQLEDIKNWRPISLLNTDVKILSKMLAERIRKVLPDIIHTDQKGCIQGCFIGQNIRLIEDILESCDEEQVIVFLDQQKAFDRVEHSWLFMVLDKFGFENNFKKWLRILYRDMLIAILTNGYVSRYFPIRRDIRRGDSLSALFYVIQSQPLSAMIRKYLDITGIEISGYDDTREIKSKQYVDDTFICLRNFSEIEKSLNLVEAFGKASGSKLNKN